MAAGGGKDFEFMALAINADASKRQEQLEGDKLASGLHEIAKLAAAQATLPEKAEALAALHVSQHASRQAKAAIEAAILASRQAKAAIEAANGEGSEATRATVETVEKKWQKTTEAAKLATEHSETAMRKAMEAAERMPDKVQPSIVTISEMSGEDALETFREKLGTSWKVLSHSFKAKSADRIVTAYNTDIWELQPNYPASDEGHYLLTKLRMKANNMLLAYFSVHLPHKSGKEKAYNCIKKAIEECCTDADLVMIGGDWNMTPQEIEDQFKGSTRPIDKSKLAFITGRTNEGSTEKVIDNFALISQQQRYSRFSEKRIMNEMQVEKYTTHAPIWAEVRLTPSKKSSSSKANTPSSSKANTPSSSKAKMQINKEP